MSGNKVGYLVLIWDYDGAIGQINATYPYKFDEGKIIQEIRNVDTILELGQTYNVVMTFACVGSIAEEGHYPYHVPDQIRTIHKKGHEIASHSWKHEWFPYLERNQIVKSLSRSKYILEETIGETGSVVGFVPPFSRPMSWYRKFAISLGDRALRPWHPGADLGSLIPIVKQTNYQWCRVTYQTIFQKLSRTSNFIDLKRHWHKHHDITCVPLHYCGFNKPAIELIDKAVMEHGTVVICGHPSGLTRQSEENISHLESFLTIVNKYQQLGDIRTITVSHNIGLQNNG